jgi:hypothetical protein
VYSTVISIINKWIERKISNRYVLCSRWFSVSSESTCNFIRVKTIVDVACIDECEPSAPAADLTRESRSDATRGTRTCLCSPSIIPTACCTSVHWWSYKHYLPRVRKKPCIASFRAFSPQLPESFWTQYVTVQYVNVVSTWCPHGNCSWILLLPSMTGTRSTKDTFAHPAACVGYVRCARTPFAWSVHQLNCHKRRRTLV